MELFSESAEAPPVVLLASTLPEFSLMTTAHLVYPSASVCVSLSPDSELPASLERASECIADETSPLIPPKHPPRRTIFAWWNSFLDDNLGLLLVAASQFFFSSMNMSVKWLNSSDEPVPTLEVCLKRPEQLYPELTIFAICVVDPSPNGMQPDVSFEGIKIDGELGHHIRLLSRIHVQPPFAAFLGCHLSLPGTGREFQTHYSVQVVYGPC